MDVAIAGGHGNVGRRLGRRLVAHGDKVRALIRNPDHADDVRADGSEPVLCDLEQAAVDEIAAAIAGADAVVFAAGAGPGSGAERKWSMDRDGAIKLLHAARSAGVERYVMVSSIGAENPPGRRRRVQRLPAREGRGRPGADEERPRMDDRETRFPHRRSWDRPGAH